MQKSPLKNRTGLLDTYDIGSFRVDTKFRDTKVSEISHFFNVAKFREQFPFVFREISRNKLKISRNTK
jgi:hypothetical protein